MTRIYNLLLLLILLAGGLMIIPERAWAATGCCQVLQSGTSSAYQTTTPERCLELNQQYTSNLSLVFKENQEASSDGLRCIAIDSPTPVNSSLPKISITPIATPSLSVSVPGLALTGSTCDNLNCNSPWLAQYINGLYKYGLGIIGILAVVAMMIGGVLWLTSAGNTERVGDAKKWIGGSIMGVLIAMTSYMILNLVNPALTELSPLKLNSIPNEPLADITLDEVTSNNVSSGTIQSKGQECYFNTFGNSASEVEKNLVAVNFFGKSLRVHKLAKAAYENVYNELKGKTSYNFYDLGTFNWRANVNNPSKQSLHSFGIAIDINPGQNPNGGHPPCTRTNLPANVIEAFKRNGFRWGGDYRKTCDTMHFEWLGPCQK